MEETTTSTLPEPAVLAPTPPLAEPARSFSPRKLWQRAHGVSPFASNVALTVTTNVAIALTAFVTGPLSARLLGPSGRGELAAIQNLYWIVAILAMLGMPEAALYFSAQRSNERNRVLASALVIPLLASPLFFLAVYRFIPMFLAAQSPKVVRAASLCLLGIPLYAICNIPLFALRGSHDLLRWNILRTLPTVGWLLLLLLAGRLVSATPQAIAFGYLCILAGASVPTLYVALHRVGGRFAPEPKSWPPMLKYGLPLAGAAIPYHLNLRLDQMLMAAFLPAYSLGLYVVAVSWSGAVFPLLVAIAAVLFPRVAGADAPRRADLLIQAARVSMFLGIILGALVALATPVAIPLLFGRAFSGSIIVGVVLVLAAVICGMNVVFEEGLRGLGEPASVFWGEAAGLMVTVAALLILLRPLGILGAGIASILGYLGTAVVLLAKVRKRTGCSSGDLLLVKSKDLTMLRCKINDLHSAMRN